MEELQEKIISEFKEFKKDILSKRPEEIWEGCCKIYFYSSLYEYFTYNGKIPYVVVENLKTYSHILEGCWQLYLRKKNCPFCHGQILIIYWKYLLGKKDKIYEDERICRNHQRQDNGKDRGCCGNCHKTGTEK